MSAWAAICDPVLFSGPQQAPLGDVPRPAPQNNLGPTYLDSTYGASRFPGSAVTAYVTIGLRVCNDLEREREREG